MRSDSGCNATPTQLLDFEPLPGDQVPLLLEMKEDRIALVKAVNSGDTDLSERKRSDGGNITV